MIETLILFKVGFQINFSLLSLSLVLSSVLAIEEMQRNVFGEPLKLCSLSPVTGNKTISTRRIGVKSITTYHQH